MFSFIKCDSAVKKAQWQAVDHNTGKILLTGLLLRFLMIALALNADFTDIDYHIITDAARYLEVHIDWSALTFKM